MFLAVLHSRTFQTENFNLFCLCTYVKSPLQQNFSAVTFTLVPLPAFIVSFALLFRGSAVSSVPLKWSVCYVWVVLPGNWTTTSSMVLLCWFCWSVCSAWRLTGWLAYGSASETTRWSTKTPTAWERTAGCSFSAKQLGHHTGSISRALGAGRVGPARTRSTSRHCTSPWPAWPALVLETSHPTQTVKRSLLWPWWWLDVSPLDTVNVSTLFNAQSQFHILASPLHHGKSPAV